MIAYLDSSVILKIIYNQSTKQMVDLSKFSHGISSELLQLECLRTADRFRITNNEKESDYLNRIDLIYSAIKKIELIKVSSTVLSRASQSFPVTLGSLDAIHLASCLLYFERSKEPVTLCSHDESLKKAAKAVGLDVAG